MFLGRFGNALAVLSVATLIEVSGLGCSDTGTIGVPECPTPCDDGIRCTQDSRAGSECSAKCIFEPITVCIQDDGCCPANCDPTTDNDCSTTCGNGIVENGEVCDDSCPVSCDDHRLCTNDTLVGSAENCSAECSYAAITLCQDGDDCCPLDCSEETDADCAVTTDLCGDDLIVSPCLCGVETLDGGYCCNGTPEDLPCPTCTDGIQNQSEVGVDCGGPCPGTCSNDSTVFSPIPIYGDRLSYIELTPTRWQLTDEQGSRRYSLHTTQYSAQSGSRLGEYSLVRGEVHGDVLISALARSADDFASNDSADFALILGFIDENNYYYAMFNRYVSDSAIFMVRDGARTELANVNANTFVDNLYHIVEFQRVGSTLSMFFDGSVVASASNDLLGAGQVGVGSFNDSVSFDDIQVSVVVTSGSCGDETRNNGETDVDCGGATSGCARCGIDHLCVSGTDCLSGVCINGFCQPAITGTTFYVATNGDDSLPNGDGTFLKPWATWQKGFDALGPGDALYIRGGVYEVSAGVRVNGHHGSADNRISVMAYPGEEPVLDLSLSQAVGQTGLNLADCSYWYLKGLTVQHTPENGGLAIGVNISDSNWMTFDRCVSRRNAGPGFAIHGFSDYSSYVNCDAYENVDSADNGGWADGFIASHYGGVGNYHTSYSGCRSWSNSDDGFDRFVAPSDTGNKGGYMTWQNCWAWDNGKDDGNGSGFKWGRTDGYEPGNPVQIVITNCLAFNNRGFGFDQSECEAIGTLYNNIAFQNGWSGFFSNRDTPCVFRNNISLANVGGVFGEQTSFVHDHNSWNGGITVDDTDFVTVDSTGVAGARGVHGSLPDLLFLRLAPGSDLINAGTDVGLPFLGDHPDLGPYERE